MKKALVAIAVLASCLAAGWGLWSCSHDQPVAAAAQLVPAETLVLAELPDLHATALRWRQTALAQILAEPEVQRFLVQPRFQLQQNETWGGALRSLASIKPQRAFFALTSLSNNMPHAVGGFSFAGDREAVEVLIAKARAQAQTASPQGKLEKVNYGPFQIESFSDNGVCVAGCFARNWYLVANDVELLKATLDRLSGKPLTALAAAPSYRESRKALPADPDLCFFSQPGVLSGKLLAQLRSSGSEDDSREPSGDGKIQGVALASRFEGARMRDVLFVYEPQASLRPLLSRKTLGLTTPNTLFYGAMAPLIPDEIPSGDRPSVPESNAMRALLAVSNPSGGTLSQFKTAFGPEHAVLLNWSAASQPNVYLALEVRDSAQARKFVESVFRAWSRADDVGVSFWTLSTGNPSMAQIHPTVALTDHHLLAGLSLESLKPFASTALHIPPEGGTLQQSSAFTSAMASVPKPQIGLAYLDFQPFFERVYGWLRPAAMLWGGSIADLGGIVDFGKLPTPPTIAKHLGPICLSATQNDSGLLLESTGPVTFLEVAVGVGAAASMVLMPAIQRTPTVPGLGTPPRILPSPLSFPQILPPFASPSSTGTSR